VTPRVTVLLAVYNGDAYLREGVDSVLGQTFEDFELLIVDDASTDGAVASLPHDPRIRVLRNEQNIGQIPSMNRGLREARGDYVARLDHDDVCLPRRLERQVALLDARPEVALTATWVDIVDTQGRLWTHVRPRVDSFSDFVCHVTTGHVHLVHPSLMFRRELVVQLGGFDERLNAAEDQDLYRRLVLGRHEARVVPETLLLYRRHEQQMTVAKSASVWESDARSYDRFLAALAPGVPASTVRLMLRNDPRFWSERALAADWLERFLVEAAATLELTGPERSVLARALSRSATATMLSGWAGDGDPAAYPAQGLTLAAFAALHGDPRSRALASAAPLLARTAGAGMYVGAGRAQLTRALRSDAFAAARRAARNSRVLRRMYARVIDTRERDY
jgi:glycosyltransferase involved in cell wall biosynthesis